MNHLNWFNYQDIYDDMVDRYDNCLFAELGCFIGNSTLYLLDRILKKGKNIKVVAVDLWPAPHELKRLSYLGAGQGQEGKIINSNGQSLMQNFIDNIDVYRDWVIPIRASTKNASQIFPFNHFKFIFIDAGHEYHMVKEDIQLWYPLLDKNGTIAGHDYDCEGVKRATKEFFGQVKVSNTSWIYESIN